MKVFHPSIVPGFLTLGSESAAAFSVKAAAKDDNPLSFSAFAPSRGDWGKSSSFVQSEFQQNELTGQLCESIRSHGVDKVRELLLDKSIDVNGLDSSGFTPLEHAIWSLRGQKPSDPSRLAVLRELLKHPKIDVNPKIKHGFTPLRTAICDGEKGLVALRELLKHKNIEVDADWGSALHEAILLGNVGAVQELRKHNHITRELINANFGAALHLAIRMGHVHIVQELLRDESIDVNGRGSKGQTPLEHAIWSLRGQKPSDPFYSTRLAVLRELLKHPKIDVNPKIKHGFTPLRTAISDGEKGLVALRELLKHKNIKVNADWGTSFLPDWGSALHEAISLGNVGAVQELRKHNHITRELINANFGAALHLAIRMGRVHIVQELLKHDLIDVNILDEYGDRPLQAILLHVVNSLSPHGPDIAKALLQDPRVEVLAVDKKGRTPFALLDDQQFEAIRDLLEADLKRVRDAHRAISSVSKTWPTVDASAQDKVFGNRDLDFFLPPATDDASPQDLVFRHRVLIQIIGRNLLPRRGVKTFFGNVLKARKAQGKFIWNAVRDEAEWKMLKLMYPEPAAASSTTKRDIPDQGATNEAPPPVEAATEGDIPAQGATKEALPVEAATEDAADYDGDDESDFGKSSFVQSESAQRNELSEK